MFENLTKDKDIEAPKDTVGSGGLLGSNLYDATVDMAYTEKSNKGATGIVLHFKLDGGRFYRQTIWVTNRAGQHVWAKDGRKGYMPGFVLFDEMCVQLTGNDASQLAKPEKKTIKVYDYTSRKEQAVEKDVLTSFIGQKIKLGIIQLKEDHYKDTKTWAEKNEIEKVFSPEGLTVSEKIAGISTGEFAAKWSEKYQFEVVDKRKESASGRKYFYRGGNDTPEAGAEGTDNAPAAPSLFAPKVDAPEEVK